MEANGKKQSKKMLNQNHSDTQKQNSLALTGNEKHDKDVFIDIEPMSKTNLLVTDKANQQVAQTHEKLGDGQDISEPSGTSSATELDDETALPDTLTRLTTSNGSEVFLIGTAHFSVKSAKDVQKVMRTIKPSAVVLELCEERAFMLTLDEQELLRQSSNLSFEKIRSAIAEKGLAQGLIYVIFIKMSAGLTKKLGLAPGSEFRAGVAEARKIPGCNIVLADRSLKVTVARVVASVSIWQKIKLIYQVLVNDLSITPEDVEKCKEKDMIEQLLQELGGEFPGFKRVLLDERNVYLAHSIYQWAQNSETSLGPQRIVAIVGIGHVSGIVEHWGKTTDDQIRLLKEVPKTSKTRRIVTKTIKYCSIALLLYVGYRVIMPSSIQTAIQDKFVR